TAAPAADGSSSPARPKTSPSRTRPRRGSSARNSGARSTRRPSPAGTRRSTSTRSRATRSRTIWRRRTRSPRRRSHSRAGRTGDVKHVRAVQTLHRGATGKVARRRGIGRKRGLARLLRECISDPFIRFRFRATPMTPSLRALRALALPLAALLLVPTAAAQWTTQSPMPTHLDVRGIAAPTAQRIFVGTEDDSFDDGGALFESQDGGATWV